MKSGAVVYDFLLNLNLDLNLSLGFYFLYFFGFGFIIYPLTLFLTYKSL